MVNLIQMPRLEQYKNGNVLGNEQGEEDIIGQDIDCVGGVRTADC